MSELSLTSSLRNAAARAIRALEQEARHAWGREAAERIRALEAPSDGHRAHHLRRADAAGRHARELDRTARELERELSQ